MNNKIREAFKIFIKSAFITLCALVLIIIGYFAAGFLFGGL